MGISPNSLEFLLLARRAGLNLERTMTLGRQGFHNLSSEALQKICARFGVELSDVEAVTMLESDPDLGEPFADSLLRGLGALKPRSLDISPFEGASDIHDMNRSLPTELDGKFTAVLDLGTLEHVWNFPVGLANSMRLVAPGGHLVIVTPTNNYCGHGMYQFSPELFFRVLRRENQFEVRLMLVREERRRPLWHLVRDPAEMGRRHGIRNCMPTELFILAERLTGPMPNEIVAYQSDYAVRWSSDASASSAAPHWTEGSRLSGPGRLLRRTLPRSVRDRISDRFTSPIAASKSIAQDPLAFPPLGPNLADVRVDQLASFVSAR